MAQCCVCFAAIGNSEVVVARDMPGLGCRGLNVAHLACYDVRVLVATKQAPFLQQRARTPEVRADDPVLPPPGAKCGLCGDAIGTSDCVHFMRCKHKWVHFQCATLVDFQKRHGCPFCRKYPAPAHLWASSSAAAASDAEDEIMQTFVAGTDVERERDRGVLSLVPVSANMVRRGMLDLMTNNAVVPVMDRRDLTMAEVRSAYESRRQFLDEPAYATVARALCFELGIDATQTPAAHPRNVTHTVRSYLQPGRCTLGDLVALGLTLPIALRTPDDARWLVTEVLRADVVSRDTLPWPYSFAGLLRRGVTVEIIAQRGRTCQDLLLLDFHVAPFLAAGGTAKQLRDLTAGIGTTNAGAHILPQFGITKDILEMINADTPF